MYVCIYKCVLSIRLKMFSENFIYVTIVMESLDMRLPSTKEGIPREHFGDLDLKCNTARTKSKNFKLENYLK